MLLELQFLAGASAAGPSGPLTPVLTGPLSRTPQTGTCTGARLSASLTLGWGVVNADDELYEIRVLENGVLVALQQTSSTSYTKTLDEYVMGAPDRRFTANWTYTVQILRKSDGVPVSTLTTSPWTATYGKCTNAL